MSADPTLAIFMSRTSESSWRALLASVSFSRGVGRSPGYRGIVCIVPLPDHSHLEFFPVMCLTQFRYPITRTWVVATADVLLYASTLAAKFVSVVLVFLGSAFACPGFEALFPTCVVECGRK